MLGAPSHGWGTFQGTSELLVEEQPSKAALDKQITRLSATKMHKTHKKFLFL
jgi:hypothetical protein